MQQILVIVFFGAAILAVAMRRTITPRLARRIGCISLLGMGVSTAGFLLIVETNVLMDFIGSWLGGLFFVLLMVCSLTAAIIALVGFLNSWLSPANRDL